MLSQNFKDCQIYIFFLFVHSFLAKSDELPKKPLGQERPVVLVPFQSDSPLEVKINQQADNKIVTETCLTDDSALQQTPSSTESQNSKSFSETNTPSSDSVVDQTQGTPSPLRSRIAPSLPPKAKKPIIEVGLVKDTKNFLPEVCPDRKQENETNKPKPQEEPMDWPPPYEPSALEAITMQTAEEIMDLPDLPPPPLFYPEQSEQRSQNNESPTSRTGTGPNIQLCSPSPHSASPLVTRMKVSPKPSPKLSPKPRLASYVTKVKSPPHSAYTPNSSSSPRLPPAKPTKFPVSLYVPASMGDRRPSNTSQYDNLSEADDDDHFVERLLASTPEEYPLMHSTPPFTTDRNYDPTFYPVPPPPVFIPPSPSPVLSAMCALPSLPQEPEYRGEDSWVEDSIIHSPPPSFADRLVPFQCASANCSDTHRAVSPVYPKNFSRGPRDHSAFPAPLLYTRSPPGHSRSSGQSPVGVALTQSSQDFCRTPPGGQKLPKSVTF